MKPVVVVLIGMAVVGCKARRASVVPPPPTMTVAKPEPAESTVKSGNSVVAAPAETAAKPAPAQRVRRATRTSPSATQAEQAASPALELLRTPQERQKIISRIRESVARAEANISALRSRELGEDAERALGRVDSFLRQAHSAVESNDLATASQYAQRAELLSSDLLKR